MTKEDLVLEGAHAVMRITKREVDWNTAVRISRCIMAMQDVSAVKESLTAPKGWQLVPIGLTKGMRDEFRKYLIGPAHHSPDGCYSVFLKAAPVYSGSSKRLQDMSKAELIDLIEQQQQELDAIGAGGVSGKLMS